MPAELIDLRLKYLRLGLLRQPASELPLRTLGSLDLRSRAPTVCRSIGTNGPYRPPGGSTWPCLAMSRNALPSSVRVNQGGSGSPSHPESSPRSADASPRGHSPAPVRPPRQACLCTRSLRQRPFCGFPACRRWAAEQRRRGRRSAACLPRAWLQQAGRGTPVAVKAAEECQPARYQLCEAGQWISPNCCCTPGCPSARRS